jgi:hypothetical protein
MGDLLAQNRENGNGAKVGKNGYILNVIAFDRCPSGDFLNSNRRQIAVQARYPGDATNKLVRTNKIFLKKGDDFQVQDGNACDDGAEFYLPITDANCSNCGDGDVEPTFTQYKVYARLVGKPGSGVTVTSCVEVVMIVEDVETTEWLCSVGADNIWVKTRVVGSGKEQNKWENVSKQLLTVCVDTGDDGVCDKRVGLFDEYGEDYWWNWGTHGRPHVQLVFVPATSG